MSENLLIKSCKFTNQLRKLLLIKNSVVLVEGKIYLVTDLHIHTYVNGKLNSLVRVLEKVE
jgi:hypothetical protein